MSTEPFVGEIKLFGFYFAPLYYQNCEGQLLNISRYTALYALLGTTFGGDGQTTFALPDLKGRVPIGQGNGAGLPPYEMGQGSGSANTTILTSNLPSHVHTANSVRVLQKASSANAGEQTPEGTFPGVTGSAVYSDSVTPNVYSGKALLSGTTDIAGSGISLGTMNPFLCMNYSIAIEGIFPSRN